MSTGPVWLQRMVRRGGIFGLIMAVAGVVVHPSTAEILHVGNGDAQSSSYLMFIGFCLTAFAKPIQSFFRDVVLDDEPSTKQDPPDDESPSGEAQS